MYLILKNILNLNLAEVIPVVFVANPANPENLAKENPAAKANPVKVKPENPAKPENPVSQEEDKKKI